MKNAIKIDFINNRILMTRAFAKLASDVRSKEYEMLQKARCDYPNYTVEIRTIKRNPDKETYAGLTYNYMMDYIRTHEAAETRELVLAEFNEMLLISKCHSKAFRYPTIKKWFLEKYPAVAEFGTTAQETEECAAARFTALPDSNQTAA